MDSSGMAAAAAGSSRPPLKKSRAHFLEDDDENSSGSSSPGWNVGITKRRSSEDSTRKWPRTERDESYYDKENIPVNTSPLEYVRNTERAQHRSAEASHYPLSPVKSGIDDGKQNIKRKIALFERFSLSGSFDDFDDPADETHPVHDNFYSDEDEPIELPYPRKKEMVEISEESDSTSQETVPRSVYSEENRESSSVESDDEAACDLSCQPCIEYPDDDEDETQSSDGVHSFTTCQRSPMVFDANDNAQAEGCGDETVIIHRRSLGNRMQGLAHLVGNLEGIVEKNPELHRELEMLVEEVEQKLVDFEEDIGAMDFASPVCYQIDYDWEKFKNN